MECLGTTHTAHSLVCYVHDQHEPNNERMNADGGGATAAPPAARGFATTRVCVCAGAALRIARPAAAKNE